MNKKEFLSILEWLPFIFYIFLASFLIMKFIFIFFLNASFTPSFIFDLTPLSLLPGMNNLQLLFASLLIVLVDTYLHVTNNRRHLRYSFIPTGIMIAGISTAIIKQPGNIGYVSHYMLFAFLLIATLIDQRILLIMPEKMAEKKTLLGPPAIPSKEAISDIMSSPIESMVTLTPEETTPRGISPPSAKATAGLGSTGEDKLILKKHIRLPKKIFKLTRVVKPTTHYYEKYPIKNEVDDKIHKKKTQFKYSNDSKIDEKVDKLFLSKKIDKLFLNPRK